MRELLSLRDGREWDQRSTDWFFCELEPSRCLAWLAWDGARPIGVTSVYVRTLALERREWRVGYWANLFVHPDYGNRMLYPRLPLAMQQGSRRAGLDFLYGSIRRQDVADAHLKIGWGEVGTVNVLIKPLRPASLVAKHLSLGRIVRALGVPLDAVFRLFPERSWRGTAKKLAVEPLSCHDVDALVDGLNRGASGQVAQRWTHEGWRERFRQTREGGQYFSFASRAGDLPSGAVVGRVAIRGEGIRAGVVMDVIANSDREEDAVPALLTAERRAYREGAEAMLFLDGLGPELGGIVRRLGYRASRETYRTIVWPKTVLAERPELADVARWRFAFADHDAF
ncbi:MAG: hypothetical protein ACREQJ_10475 [Candidatus Binatia bacterium]